MKVFCNQGLHILNLISVINLNFIVSLTIRVNLILVFVKVFNLRSTKKGELVLY